MDTTAYFSPSEKAFLQKTFACAERLTANYFHLVAEAWKIHRYDVKTLAHLEDHEVRKGAFAHLCKYSRHPKDPKDNPRGLHFYRVCLQDNQILDALKRGGSFIRFPPFMLYIATHELVHILRFDRGESDFDMPVVERTNEEDRVHSITRTILLPVAHPELNLVIDCFSNSYVIGDLSN